MRKLLIPVDSHNAARVKSAITQAVAIYRQEPVEVHLLSVQPAVSGHVAMFFPAGELAAIQQQQGMEDLAPAKAQLEAAGVPYQARVVVGRSAETIARLARETGCDRIVMGQENGAGFAESMFGSLAGQVRHLTGGAGDCQVLGS